MVGHEHEIVVTMPRPARVANPFGDRRELPRRVRRGAQLMDLGGFAGAREDQGLASGRVPARQYCRAEIAVGPHAVGDGLRDGGDAVRDEARGGRYHGHGSPRGDNRGQQAGRDLHWTACSGPGTRIPCMRTL